MAAAGFLFILGLALAPSAWAVRCEPCVVFRQGLYRPIFSSLIFGAVRWAAGKGWRDKRDDASDEQESPERHSAQNKPTTRAWGNLKNLIERGFSK
jgi:hypothetical protein